MGGWVGPRDSLDVLEITETPYPKGLGTWTVQFVVLSQYQESSTDGTRKVVWR
jgi:hypothetical protein